MPEPFIFDLSRTAWRPTNLEVLTSELRYALEQEVRPDEVEFAGTEVGAAPDAAKEILDSDESVREFCGLSDEGDVNGHSPPLRKVIRTELPARIAAVLRRPRALALLATGRQVSKFAGELEGGGSEFSLRLFDCGHFRIKETAQGSPGVGVWEGKWEETSTSVKLQLLLHSQEQQQARRRSGDSAGTLQMVPPELRVAELAVSGGDDSGEEARLHGDLPTMFGASPICRVQFHAEAMDPRQAASGDDLRMQVKHGRPAADDSDDDAEYRQMLREAARRPRPVPPPKKREWEDDFDSDEPRWPMYLGIFLFIVIFLTFSWALYEDWYGEEPAKEFDEL
mmetsp:Transcript_15390/g.43691  ORF Transcript_15390/g.43691 Transcript_15390/m.43691 type:complete len:338 (-) Transcript_15390:74-1087(-)